LFIYVFHLLTQVPHVFSPMVQAAAVSAAASSWIPVAY